MHYLLVAKSASIFIAKVEQLQFMHCAPVYTSSHQILQNSCSRHIYNAIRKEFQPESIHSTS